MKPIDIKVFLKRQKRWLDKPENKAFFVDKQVADIRHVLGRSPQYTFDVSLFTRLLVLSNWESASGTYLVLKNDPQGWRHIQGCFTYRAWEHRIKAAFKDHKTWSGAFQLWELRVLCLAHRIGVFEPGGTAGINERFPIARVTVGKNEA